MQEITPTGRIVVELNKGSELVDIHPEWATRFNADGITYQTPDELVLIPWGSIARVRQPVSDAGHEAADADVPAARRQHGRSRLA